MKTSKSQRERIGTMSKHVFPNPRSLSHGLQKYAEINIRTNSLHRKVRETVISTHPVVRWLYRVVQMVSTYDIDSIGCLV